MKKAILLTMLICSLRGISAQPLTVGYLGGMGFSDYHGQYGPGRWQSQGSALSAIFLRYDVTPVFSVGTEFGYSRQEYTHKYYGSVNRYIYYENYYDPASSYYDPYYPYYPNYPYYYQLRETWSYDFLRIPLYVTLSTPTKLQLSVSIGMYVSFRTSSDYNNPSWYPNYYNKLHSFWAYPIMGNTNTPRHDNGMWYSASLSYPLTPEFRVYAQGRMTVGHRNFLASKTGRTGMSEYAFGLAYTGLFNHHVSQVASSLADTSQARFRIVPKVGAGIAWARKSTFPAAYESNHSASFEIQVEYRLDRNFSLVSGLGFARKGYSLKDSSVDYYRHALTTGKPYQVMTKVDLDYAVIPLLLKVRMGSGFKVYMEAGIYGGFNLNDRVTGTSEVIYASETSYQKQEISVYDNLESEVNDFELGWELGTGLEVPAGRLGAVTLGVAYSTGGKNILKKNDDRDRYLLDPDSDIRNGYLNVQLGLVIPVTLQK